MTDMDALERDCEAALPTQWRPIEIVVSDATQRAQMWGDFAHEFIRLGMLAGAMRGAPEISAMARRTAMACRNEMTREIQIAETHLALLNDLCAVAASKVPA